MSVFGEGVMEWLFDRKEIARRLLLKRLMKGSVVATGAVLAKRFMSGESNPAFAAEHPHRVVRVHSADATSWDWSSNYYYSDECIDSDVVKSMVNEALQRLIDASTPTQAWQEIMASYVPGDKVVIKVNLNNISGEHDQDNTMDATAPIVDAVLDGLIQNAGIPQANILVYDTLRAMPVERLVSRSSYPPSVFSSNYRVYDESVEIAFVDPLQYPDEHHYVSLDLTNAQHLINIPLLKCHGNAAVTGALKNHLGTIRRPWRLDHANIGNNSYIADVNNNPHIRDKTRLIVCDALFGNYQGNQGAPLQWQTFGNGSPNSVLVSLDPVATDSVMLSMIQAERTARSLASKPFGYLDVAMDYGLGVHETPPFDEIEYIEAQLGQTTRSDVDRAIRQHKEGEATEGEVLSVIEGYMSGE